MSTMMGLSMVSGPSRSTELPSQLLDMPGGFRRHKKNRFIGRKSIITMLKFWLLTVALVLCSLPNACHSRPLGSSSSRMRSAFVTSPIREKWLSRMNGIEVWNKSRSTMYMSSELRRNDDGESASFPEPAATREEEAPPTQDDSKSSGDWITGLLSESPLNNFLSRELSGQKPPPMQVEDANVLFYDIFLLLNMSLSVSFWVVHRMSYEYIGSAVSEGSLLCILWILAGLWHGAFLNSAVDGHFGSTSDKGGPRAAGMLGLHTFITTSNLRILVALAMAALEHRKVGAFVGEQLIPLEVVIGLVLMSTWRALHSSVVPRL